MPDNVDYRLIDIIAATIEKERARPENGGSGGGGSDMQNGRIRDLEQSMTDVKVSLARTETKLGNIESNMFTKAQASRYAVVMLLAVLGGGWWLVQQFLAPIVVGLSKLH